MEDNWLQVLLRNKWSPLNEREGLLFWRRRCCQNPGQMVSFSGSDPVLVLGVKVGAPPQQVVEDTELEGLRQRVLA